MSTTSKGFSPSDLSLGALICFIFFFAFRSLSDVSYSDEYRIKQCFQFAKRMFPLFCAIVKFCRTIRLFADGYISIGNVFLTGSGKFSDCREYFHGLLFDTFCEFHCTSITIFMFVILRCIQKRIHCCHIHVIIFTVIRASQFMVAVINGNNRRHSNKVLKLLLQPR